MTDAELRRRFFVEVTRSREARHRLAERTDEAVLFTERLMSSLEFQTHSRSERAILRWDSIGGDEVGWPMLAQFDLTAHAVKILSEMTELNEALDHRLQAAPYRRGSFIVRLRSEPHDDVVTTISDGVVSIALEPPGEAHADVYLDSAARLLAL